MCGIFGYIGKKNTAADIVLEGLKKLEYRGYDSWGVAVSQNNQIVIKKKVGKIGDATVKELPASSFGLGHTRWATHGGVTDENAHPHKDCTGTLAVIHNGIIENYLELKKELQKKNHTFLSETDTEVIAHLVEEYLKKNTLEEAVRLAFNSLLGRNAIVIFSAKENKLVAAKNGSPIILGKDNNTVFLASDASALLPYTRDVVFLSDGNLAILARNTIEIRELATGNTKKAEFIHLDWEIEQAEKGLYPHFLLKEIMEQGETLETAVTQPEEKIKEFTNAIQSSYGTYFVGCGTGGHACRAASYIFSIIAKRHINFSVGSEFAYVEHFLTDKSLLVAVSQSGETADILEAVAAARRHGSRVASLVNVIGSTLARESDLFLPLRVGPEKSVLSTKAFTGKLALFYLLAYTIVGKYEEGKKQLLKTAKAITILVHEESFHNTLKALADRIYQNQDIYIIGRGVSFPSALEAAHKIKEASYIHAEGFAGGEPKHCEISLISKNTPCIVFVPNDETRPAILSNAMEFKSRGGMIIGISPKNEEVFDEWIRIPDVGVTTSIIQVIPAQLLAYYLALRRGNDPDMPRNLAKSVTVK